jgi:hypothetical protein
MAHPYRRHLLAQLGLVAGLFDERGSGEGIDQATQQKPARRLVTAGHAVHALVRHGLSVMTQPLYLVPRLFQDQLTARRFPPAWSAATHRNAEALGRAVETL